VHEYIRDMNREVLAPHDVFTVGEAPFSFSAQDLAEYVLPANHELDMVFQFEVCFPSYHSCTRH
jgi:oligo-1,6-glucosidase